MSAQVQIQVTVDIPDGATHFTGHQNELASGSGVDFFKKGAVADNPCWFIFDRSLAQWVVFQGGQGATRRTKPIPFVKKAKPKGEQSLWVLAYDTDYGMRWDHTWVRFLLDRKLNDQESAEFLTQNGIRHVNLDAIGWSKVKVHKITRRNRQPRPRLPKTP